jgi:hypothetical protein
MRVCFVPAMVFCRSQTCETRHSQIDQQMRLAKAGTQRLRLIQRRKFCTGLYPLPHKRMQHSPNLLPTCSIPGQHMSIHQPDQTYVVCNDTSLHRSRTGLHPCRLPCISSDLQFHIELIDRCLLLCIIHPFDDSPNSSPPHAFRLPV